MIPRAPVVERDLANKVKLSALIITRNEERNLPQCLDCLQGADDIVVLDSFSTDQTVTSARKLGARIFQREFDNFARQKNWAIDNIDFRHQWLLIVDADERVTPDLAREIKQVLSSSPDYDGYYIARKNMFAGKWIKHGGWYPDWQMRLIRLGNARYEDRIVHEHVILDGQAGYLKNPLIHHDYKGVERYFDRHNVYSSMEAVEIARSLNNCRKVDYISPKLIARGPSRRRYLKNLAYRYLPARPFFKFLWMYILKLGFLDGKIGFRFSMLHAFYDYQISLKLLELKEKNSPLYEKYREYLEK